MRWHPRRLVGGNGGTYICSFNHSSPSPGRIFPLETLANSRVSLASTLPRQRYWIVSVKDALVDFIVTCWIISILYVYLNVDLASHAHNTRSNCCVVCNVFRCPIISIPISLWNLQKMKTNFILTLHYGNSAL